MKVAGSYTMRAPRPEVWAALQDPAVLARTLPGCRRLEVTAPDRYAVTVDAGVASIKGTYEGRVEVSDKQAPDRYVMTASGQGGPGTVHADAVIRLHDADGGGTRIEYDADAIVGGMIGGVGQRVLVGVSQKTASEFFAAVERELLEGPTPLAPVAPGEEAAPAAVVPGQVFEGAPRRAPAAGPAWQLLVAAAVGAAIALAGVLLGRRLAR